MYIRADVNPIYDEDPRLLKRIVADPNTRPAMLDHICKNVISEKTELLSRSDFDISSLASLLYLIATNPNTIESTLRYIYDNCVNDSELAYSLAGLLENPNTPDDIVNTLIDNHDAVLKVDPEKCPEAVLVQILKAHGALINPRIIMDLIDNRNFSQSDKAEIIESCDITSRLKIYVDCDADCGNLADDIYNEVYREISADPRFVELNVWLFEQYEDTDGKMIDTYSVYIMFRYIQDNRSEAVLETAVCDAILESYGDYLSDAYWEVYVGTTCI